LARLLVPANFGVVAIATSLVALLELLTAFNFDTVLIQHPQPTRQHLDTVWTLTLLFAVVIGAMLCLIAVPAASFYHDPRLAPVMMAIGLNQMIGGCANVGTVFFRRDLDFRRDFLLQVGARLVGFAVTLPLAFLWRDHWALVAGMIAANLTTVAISYAMHAYRARWSLAALREMFHASFWLFINNCVNFLRTRCI